MMTGVRAPFVGRTAELAQLRARIADGAAGRGGIVLVRGPAGIGKTRLVEEALDGDRTPVAVGRGDSRHELAPPLWPIRQALLGLQRTAGPARGEPVRTLRELLDDPAGSENDSIGIGGPAAIAWEGMNRLGRVAEALLAVADAGPVLLVLEDLHWADAETVRLLDVLAPQLAHAACVLVGTARPDESADGAGDLGRRAGVLTIDLEPLGIAEVGDFLRRVDPATPTEAAAAVHRRSGGLPLLLSAARPGRVAAAADVDQLVAGLTREFDPATLEILRLTAAVRAEVDVELVAGAAGIEEADVIAAIRRAEAAGLLVRTDGGGYAFVHDLVRDRLAGAVPPARRRRLHAGAAVALEGRTGEPAAAVAAHWGQAGPEVDSARRAAQWWLAAADQARRALAYVDMGRHAERAVTALTAAGAPAAEVAGAGITLAEAHYLAGRYDAALAAATEASRQGRAASRPDLMAAAALVVRWVTYRQVTEVVTALCRDALRADEAATTPMLDDAIRSRLLSQIATVMLAEGATAPADSPVDAAMELARSSGDPQALLDAARATVMALPEHGSAHPFLDLGNLAVEQATMLGQPVGALVAHSWRMQGAVQLGRMDLVEDAMRRVQGIAEQTGLPLARWHLLRARVALAIMRGEFDRVPPLNDEATAIAEASGDGTAIVMSFAAAHEVALLRGSTADLPVGYPEALENAPRDVLTECLLGTLLALSNRLPDAEPIYRRLVALDPRQYGRPRAPVIRMLLSLAEAFDDDRAAGRLADELRPYTDVPGGGGISTAYFTGSLSRDLGQALALAGRLDEAEVALREAVARDEAVGAAPGLALARLGLAGVLARAADRAAQPAATRREAVVLAETAARDFRRMDMPGPLARADALLLELTAARRRTDPLSPRERQVADLVVAGLSNREIAGRLVLSERTIESHVRSTLTKFGCRNRGELIRTLGTPGGA